MFGVSWNGVYCINVWFSGIIFMYLCLKILINYYEIIMEWNLCCLLF